LQPLPEFPVVHVEQDLPAHGELRRSVENRPADGGKSQRLSMYVRGPKGAVQFVILRFTLSGVETVLPADLGYHSPVPRYAGQTSMTDKCHLLDGPCYYDGSGLNADEFYKAAVASGNEEAVWLMLEAYYHEIFDDAELPVVSETETSY